MWSGWLEGSISRSSLQFHFLQTLEHRTDVSVTSTSPWWEAQRSRGCPGCQLGSLQLPTLPSCSLPRCPPCARVACASGAPHGTTWSLKPPWCSPAPCLPPQPVLVPLGLETFGSVAQRHPLSCIPASAAFCSLAWS